MNKTTINKSGSLTVTFKDLQPVTLEDREVIARHVAERMYGEGHVPAGLPSPMCPEYYGWVLDTHNDWTLSLHEDDPSKITVTHRNPQERHTLIIGGLAHALERMIVILLPSQLVHNEPLGPPVFVMEDPNFLGLPTDEGEERRKGYEGERKLDCALRPCYVHGTLERTVGYDIAMFAKGHILDLDEQEATLFDSAGTEHKCVMVAIKLPHMEENTRAAFIVAHEDKDRTFEYLRAKVKATSPRSPRPMV